LNGTIILLAILMNIYLTWIQASYGKLEA